MGTRIRDAALCRDVTKQQVGVAFDFLKGHMLPTELLQHLFTVLPTYPAPLMCGTNALDCCMYIVPEIILSDDCLAQGTLCTSLQTVKSIQTASLWAR